MSDSLLSLEIAHRVGVLALDIAFELTQPWTVLFGPSGSGKTTVMRAIAGFVRPDKGRIVRGASVLLESQAGVFVPAYARPVRSAGQTARLFPHMPVEANLQFGVGAAQDAGQIADEVVAMFRLQGLVRRMPQDLSGGERERVSAARAVISAATFSGAERACLLLDEPFAGLDSAVREDLLLELRTWLVRREIPVLSVTHDVGEAFQLGAEVIKIAEGRLVAQGPVGEVLAVERSRLMEQLGGL